MQTVDWTHDGTGYTEDVPALYAAIQAAEEVTDRPSFIVLRTVIAWPAPHAQGTGTSHGSALGEEEVAATKKVLGFDPTRHFDVPDDVLAHTRSLVERGKQWQAEWDEQFERWTNKKAADLELWERLQTRALPEGSTRCCPPSRPTRRAWPPARPPAR